MLHNDRLLFSESQCFCISQDKICLNENKFYFSLIRDRAAKTLWWFLLRLNCQNEPLNISSILTGIVLHNDRLLFSESQCFCISQDKICLNENKFYFSLIRDRAPKTLWWFLLRLHCQN